MPEPDTAALLAGYANGAMVLLLLTAGDRCGLLDGLAGCPAGVEELAARTGTDVDLVQEWVAGMSAAGLLTERAGRLELPAAVSLAPGRALVRALTGMSSMVPAVADAMRTGTGIATDVLAAAYAPNIWHMNDTRYRRELLGWVERVDGLPALLDAGAEVHEIGTGSGEAIALLAERYPAARFVGHDPAAGARQLAAARCAGLRNVHLTGEQFATRGADRSCDAVLVLDTLHHLGDPAAAVAGWAAALRPGGVLVIAEPTRELRPAPDPDAVAHATAALFYCLQDSRHAGSRGHGDGVPATLIEHWTRGAGLLPAASFAAAGGFTVSSAHRAVDS